MNTEDPGLVTQPPPVGAPSFDDLMEAVYEDSVCRARAHIRTISQHLQDSFDSETGLLSLDFYLHRARDHVAFSWTIEAFRRAGWDVTCDPKSERKDGFVLVQIRGGFES